MSRSIILDMSSKPSNLPVNEHMPLGVRPTRTTRGTRGNAMALAGAKWGEQGQVLRPADRPKNRCHFNSKTAGVVLVKKVDSNISDSLRVKIASIIGNIGKN